MPRDFTESEIDRSEKIVVRDDSTQKVQTVIFPHTTQIGLGDSRYQSKLSVQGSIHTSGSLQVGELSSSPARPGNGSGGIFYVKSDGKPYFRSYEQAEVDLLSGSVASNDISGRVALSTIDTSNDFLLIFDATDSALKKVAPSNLFTAAEISSKTTITSVDTSNDYVMIWDATDSALKKVAPTHLAAGGGGGAVASVANGVNNRLATFSSANALNGEANLTFDGSTLSVSGDISMANQSKVIFDSADTYIGANTDDPEDLDIASDQDVRLLPDNDVRVFVGATDYAVFDGSERQLALYRSVDGEHIPLRIKNQSASANANGAVSIQFDLEDTDGATVDAGKIKVKKNQSFTGTSSTQDATMGFHLTHDGTLGEKMTLDNAGNIGLLGYIRDIDNANSYIGWAGNVGIWASNNKTFIYATENGANSYCAINPGQVEIDFQVHSDNLTNALFVEGSAGNVGLATNAPAARLHVAGTIDDVDLDAASGVVIFGDSSGQHLAFDDNEIMSKSNATTAGSLYLQNSGGYIRSPAQLIMEKDTDAEHIPLILRNKSDAADTTGAVSLQFDLEDTAGNTVDSGKIKISKEQSFTNTSSTQDSKMDVLLSANGTLGSRLTLTSAGKLTVSNNVECNMLKLNQNVIMGSDGVYTMTFLGSGNASILGNLTVNGSISMSHDQKLIFDSSDTYIKANTDDPEDLDIAADQDVRLLPDNDVRVFIGGTDYAVFDGSEYQLALYRSVDGEHIPLRIKNQSAAANANGAVSIQFDLEDTDGATVDAGKIKVKKNQSFTGTSSTQNATMGFHLTHGGTLGEKMTLDNAGNIGLLGYLRDIDNTNSYIGWLGNIGIWASNNKAFIYATENGANSYCAINPGSNEIDFQVHSDNLNNALFVEGSAGNVGLATNAPAARLHVAGTIDDVDLSGASGAAIIGDSSAQHLAFDSNEIMSKSNATTAGTLYLQNEGGYISSAGQLIMQKDTNAEYVPLILRNLSDAADTTGAVSLQFDLEDTGGNTVDAGKIKVTKNQSFTATSSTQDATMGFHLTHNGTLGQMMTLDNSGNIGMLGALRDIDNADSYFSWVGNVGWLASNGKNMFFATEAGASSVFHVNPSASTIDFKVSSDTGVALAVNQSDGAVEKQYQPGFMARLSGNDTITANNSWQTVVFNTELYDIGSDYNTTNRRHTAPRSGRYMYSGVVEFNGMDKDTSYMLARLVTSDESYRIVALNPGIFDSDGDMAFTFCVVCEMSANDTAEIQVLVNNGDDITIDGGAIADGSHWSGYFLG